MEFHAILEPKMKVTLNYVHRSRLILFLFFAAFAASGQAQQTLAPAQAQALVTRALATESRLARDMSHPMRYILRKTSPRLTTTKDMIETREGNVARLLSINDQPLSAADEQKELDRLDTFMNDPHIQQRRKNREDNDTARALNILRALPKAFIYTYAGKAATSTGIIEKFNFTPNPQYDPPNLETGVLTAMTGEIWIDATQERVVRLQGRLQQDKNFGLGVLGSLYKGGSLLIEQANVGGNQWRITHMKLAMTARILFKTKISDSEQYYSHYSPLPAEISYKQAIQMLRNGPSVSEQGRR
jgi:hypothetical protein